MAFPLRTVFIGLLLLTVGPRLTRASAEQQVSFNAPMQIAEQNADLVKTLSYIAQKYDVSVLAEVAQPYPTKLRLPPGQYSLAEVMNLLVRQCPEYSWEKKDGVVWLYRRSVFVVSSNFLGLRIGSFKMPDNLGELKQRLPMYVQIAEGNGGGVTAGGPTSGQTSVKLPPGSLTDVTVRDVLLHVAKQVKIFCLFLFPNGSPSTAAEQSDALASWELIPIRELRSMPLSLRSVPARQIPN